MEASAQLLTTGQAARHCGCTRECVWQWIRTGVWIAGKNVKLQAVRYGGRWKVTREDLDAFLEACSQGKPERVRQRHERTLREECERASREATERIIARWGEPKRRKRP